ncbi:hypothetical protein [Elizabethkingia anophelis]|uniref:hypothetical protein n=1 Tax=Elizabethkingia anophelis TaxID=1117645 RepID=UPI000442B706|nr:hypothetical protein [Elizabethkingia anophelis]CDN76171.1 conserved exported hypothetical protein [Elizabethkingia anophelis]CDN80027.1 conserved exported hypothetical protein [Elizabethkingia anophelis]
MKYKIFLAFIFSIFSFAQEVKLNKKIKSDSDFLHLSGLVIPKNIDIFDRNTLITSSKNDSVISANYQDKNKENNLSIFLVPSALDEFELLGAFKNENAREGFLLSETIVKPSQYKKGKFILQELSSDFDKNEQHININIIKAGRWILLTKLIIGKKENANNFVEFSKNFKDILRPENIVEKVPLSRLSNIHYSRASFRDSLMLQSTMSSATHKMKWIYENVNKYERAAGIPELYLDYHKAGLVGFIDYSLMKKPKTPKGTQLTYDYLNAIKKIKESGFLNEFLMSKYHNCLIGPKDYIFNFDGYEKWKSDNKFDINMDDLYYVIVNSKKLIDLSKEEN